MAKPDIVLCTPVRTPIGTYGGALKDIPASDLGAAVIRETLRRSGLAADIIDSVVMGNVIQAGTRMNPARQAAIGGGLHDAFSGHTRAGIPRISSASTALRERTRIAGPRARA